MCVVSSRNVGDVTYAIFSAYEDISNAKCNCLDPSGGQTRSNDIKQYQTISNDIKRYHIEGFESDGLSTRARLNNIKQTCDL